MFGKKNEKDEKFELNPANQPQKELKNGFYQSPDDLCDFVNKNKVDVESIVSHNAGIVVFYREK